MKRHPILISAVITLCIATTIYARYSEGTGEPNNPYQIATAEDLNDIGIHQEDWDKHFILINDVNLAEYTGTHFNRIGTDWNSAFGGVFNGNDHKIWNFTWDSNGISYYIGLFGYVNTGGQIKNLGLENVDVNTADGISVGGLVGYNDGGMIINCYSTGSVSGYAWVGGLVGISYGPITNCYSKGSVSGERSYESVVGGLVGGNYGTIANCCSTCSISGIDIVGGLVGYNADGTITDSYSEGSVDGNDVVGGLVGYHSSGTITNCSSTGNVSGTTIGSSGTMVGGLVGENYDTITNCYSTGNINGTAISGFNTVVGGLVGSNALFGTITNCYSAGDVNGIGGNNVCVGGLVATNDNTITNCYSTGDVNGTGSFVNIGGLVGYNYNGAVVTASFWDVNTSGQSWSAGGTPKITAEMKKMNTFTTAGWDFIEIWGIGEKQTYPFLRTEPAGDLNHDKKVDLLDLAILALHWLEEW
jgi:hypothetical protein